MRLPDYPYSLVEDRLDDDLFCEVVWVVAGGRGAGNGDCPDRWRGLVTTQQGAVHLVLRVFIQGVDCADRVVVVGNILLVGGRDFQVIRQVNADAIVVAVALID